MKNLNLMRMIIMRIITTTTSGTNKLDSSARVVRRLSVG